MKVVKGNQTQPVEHKAKFDKAPKNRVLLYNVATGESKAFHSVDAQEILGLYPKLWTSTAPATEQIEAEDAEIIEEPKPEATEVKPVEEPKADSDATPTWDSYANKSKPKGRSRRTRNKKSDEA